MLIDSCDKFFSKFSSICVYDYFNFLIYLFDLFIILIHILFNFFNFFNIKVRLYIIKNYYEYDGCK